MHSAPRSQLARGAVFLAALTVTSAMGLVACEILLPTSDFLSGNAADASSDGAKTPDAGADAPCEGGATDTHNCGSCGHDCRGGQCSGGMCQPALMAMSGGGLPEFVAIDSERVYWAQYGAEVGVSSCPKGGCGDAGPVTLVSSSKVVGVASDGTYVYWTDNEPDGSVRRCPLDAGPCNTNDSELVASSNLPQGVAVSGGEVYWTTRPQPSGTSEWDGGVYTCAPSDCSSPDTLFLDPPYGLEGITVSGNTLYWAADDGTVRKCTLPGCSPATVIGMAGTPQSIGGVAVDDANVYWGGYIDSGAGIYSCPLAGCGEAGAVVLQPGTLVFGLAADGQAFYWTTLGPQGNTVALWVWVR
jgi:hypothetical protein